MLIVLILLNAILVTGIFTTNAPNAFADSRILKQDTKQAANCDTADAASPVSDSCNQRAANNVNNGKPRTTGMGASGSPPTTGTITVRKVCSPDCAGFTFRILVQNSQGNILNQNLAGGESQSVTVNPGDFVVREVFVPLSFLPSFSGDCVGTISAGQHLTCTITNTRT